MDIKYIFFSSILKKITVLSWIIFAIVFLLNIIFPLGMSADGITFLLTTLICVLFYKIVNVTTNDYESRPRLVIGFIVLLAFLQRIIILPIFPKSFAVYHVLRGFTVLEFNYALFVYGTLLLVCFAGIKSVCLIPVKGLAVIHTFPDYIPAKKILYIIAYMSSAITLFLGSLLNWKMGTKWEYGWLSRLFPVSLYANMLLLMWIFKGHLLHKKDKVIISFYYIFIFLWGVIQGSRGGLYSLFLSFITISIIVKGNFKLPKKATKYVLIFAILFGVILWSYGTAKRSGDWKKIDYTVLLDVSARLGEVTDNFVIEVNDWGNGNVIDSMLTLTNVFKAGMNGALPGTHFTAPFENSGNLWYTIFTGEAVGSRVQGTVWSGFGFFYVLNRYSVAVVVFLWFFVVTLLYKFLLQSKSMFYMLTAVYVTYGFVIEFFFNGAIDNFISNFLMSFGYLFILYMGVIVLMEIVEDKNSKKA